MKILRLLLVAAAAVSSGAQAARYVEYNVITSAQFPIVAYPCNCVTQTGRQVTTARFIVDTSVNPSSMGDFFSGGSNFGVSASNDRLRFQREFQSYEWNVTLNFAAGEFGNLLPSGLDLSDVVSSSATDTIPVFPTTRWGAQVVEFRSTSYDETPTSLGLVSFGIQNYQWSAVPEPASWAMLIMGFGLVGGALRSRRQATLTPA